MKRTNRSAGAAGAGQRGFTLIELMIAVVIVAILAAIALPAYGSYVKKGRRVDAKAALLDLAARQEKYFAVNNVYAKNLSDLGITYAYVNATTAATAYYTLTLTGTAVTGSTTTISDFTATATPTTVGNQSADACGYFQINYLGTQTTQYSVTGCW
jgi:type IV pilus assembly protein PilE